MRYQVRRFISDSKHSYWCVEMKRGVALLLNNCGSAQNGGKYLTAELEEAYSRKAAKRALFWLEKNHWASTEVDVMEDWLREDMRFYLHSGHKFIQLNCPHFKAWCRYEDYLERLAYVCNRRKERDAARGCVVVTR